MNRTLSLLDGARIVVGVCTAVQKGEQVLVVTDTATAPAIALAIVEAAEEVGATGTVALVRPQRSGTEPPKPVSKAMSAADVIIGAATASLYHTDAARQAVAGGARLLSLTEVSEEVLTSGAITADFALHGPTIERVRELLSKASSLRVRGPAGTDLRMSLKGREAMKITAIAAEGGNRSAAPDLEAFIAPVEGIAEGVLVVDASASNIGLVHQPIRMEMSQGRVTSISGGEQADTVAASVAQAGDEGAYVVAEFGIGLNPNALIRGHIVEDEGAYGTAHVALGNNTNFLGGQNWAPIHFDFVFRQPTIELDGVLVMSEGRLTAAARTEAR